MAKRLQQESKIQFCFIVESFNLKTIKLFKVKTNFISRIQT